MDHHVDHAVGLEIFGALKTFGQLFADGLFDHARPREPDQRARLRDLDIAEHAIGGGHTAGGWIGEHNQIGLPRLAQQLHRDGGARQLHQREDALLHARPARGRKHDEWRAVLDRRFQSGDDRLARRHAERATHEVEVLHADNHGEPFEGAAAELDGIGRRGFCAGILQAIGVAALVAELERIERYFRDRDVLPGRVVEDRFHSRGGAHAHVIIGAGNDELVRLHVLVEHELPGLRALDPQILRRLPPIEEAADLGPDDVGDPVHGLIARLRHRFKTRISL